MPMRRLAVCFLTLATLAGTRSFAADEQLHAELRALDTVYESAINSGDLTPLAPLFTPETSGVVVNNQEFKTLADLQAVYAKFHASFPDTTYHISMKPVPSQIYGDLAVAHGTCDETVKTPSGSFDYTSTWTAVLKRDGGKWTLIRSQVTMDPFGSSIVSFIVGKAKLYAGLAGLVGGLVLGIVVTRLLSRKPAAG